MRACAWIGVAVLGALLTTAVLSLGFVKTASAQNLIEKPKAHSDYDLELEGHLTFLFRRNVAPGLGVRANWELVDPGFIKGLNNTVAFGVGLDLGFNTWCEGVGEDAKCRDADLDFIIPLNLQWNFWFTPEWSAYFEPGVFIGRPRYGMAIGPNVAAGARYQVARNFLLTARVGYPSMTFGASFLF
jgi:hypothetical protein